MLCKEEIDKKIDLNWSGFYLGLQKVKFNASVSLKGEFLKTCTEIVQILVCFIVL